MIAFVLAAALAFEPDGARIESVTYKGRSAIHLVPLREGDILARVKRVEFADAVVELDVAGSPAAAAPADMRGFVGVAFRIADGRFEHFFIRPANGRADDQLRRNHALQYQALPPFPWDRLRRESPGVYESYADLEVGAWTHLKIVVAGQKARLYVNGAEQPSLVVNDLKLGVRRGGVALWAHSTTDAYFTEPVVTVVR